MIDSDEHCIPSIADSIPRLLTVASPVSNLTMKNPFGNRPKILMMQLPPVPKIMLNTSTQSKLGEELKELEGYIAAVNTNLIALNSGWKFNCKAVQSVPSLYYNDPVNIPSPPLIVGSDFSKVKAPSHQIPIAQFWNFVEQMARPLNNSDITRLETCPTTMILPELGRHYSQKWAEEDALLYQGIYVQNEKDFIEMNDAVYPCKTLGPLAENLLACLVPETVMRVVPDSLMDQDGYVPPTESGKNLMEIEDKIGKELGFLQFTIGNSSIGQNFVSESSDQIASELATLIAEYESVSQINLERKAKVLKIAKKWMAYQEYCSLLEDINKSIQSAYGKRQSAMKKAKKKNLSDTRPFPDSLLILLKSRKKLISKVGNVFFKDNLKKMPRLNESIFD